MSSSVVNSASQSNKSTASSADKNLIEAKDVDLANILNLSVEDTWALMINIRGLALPANKIIKDLKNENHLKVPEGVALTVGRTIKLRQAMLENFKQMDMNGLAAFHNKLRSCELINITHNVSLDDQF